MRLYQANKLRLLQTLPLIRQAIAHEQGEFTLFAMLQRDNLLNLWDIVVSAPWVGESITPTLKLVANELKKRLEPEDMLTISRVVVLRPEDTFVNEILAYLLTRPRTDMPWIEFANEELDGIEYERGYVFQWDEKVAAALFTEPAQIKQNKAHKSVVVARVIR